MIKKEQITQGNRLSVVAVIVIVNFLLSLYVINFLSRLTPYIIGVDEIENIWLGPLMTITLFILAIVARTLLAFPPSSKLAIINSISISFIALLETVMIGLLFGISNANPLLFSTIFFISITLGIVVFTLLILRNINKVFTSIIAIFTPLVLIPAFSYDKVIPIDIIVIMASVCVFVFVMGFYLITGRKKKKGPSKHLTLIPFLFIAINAFYITYFFINCLEFNIGSDMSILGVSDYVLMSVGIISSAFISIRFKEMYRQIIKNFGLKIMLLPQTFFMLPLAGLSVTIPLLLFAINVFVGICLLVTWINLGFIFPLFLILRDDLELVLDSIKQNLSTKNKIRLSKIMFFSNIFPIKLDYNYLLFIQTALNLLSINFKIVFHQRKYYGEIIDIVAYLGERI